MRHDLRSGVLRALSILGLAALATVLIATPASAKMPYFSLTITPADPIAGQPTMIAVRMWQDAAHRIPARFGPVALDRLLTLRSVERGPSDIPISLRYQADPDEYRATVIVPSAGEWHVVVFPDRSGWSSPQVPSGYPDTISLTVRSETDPGRPPVNGAMPRSTSNPGAGGDLPTLVVVALALALLARRHLARRLAAAGRWPLS